MREAHPRIPPHLVEPGRKSWDRLLAEQHGMVNTTQLTELGFSPAAIKANVLAGRWRPVLSRVYATTTGPLTRTARLHAALLYAGPTAVLSHRTAAEEWGMLAVEEGPVHVTVPYRCSAVSQPPDVTVHRSRAFAHITVATAPPRTGRADTVIDLAAAEATSRDAVRWFVGLLTTTPVPRADVERRLDERPPRRYRRELLAALHRIGAGVASALEDLYAVDVEAAHGIPPAVRQAPFVVDGYTLWEDALYDHLGVPLTVRLDGRQYHATPTVAFRDRRRDNVAELESRSRLSYGWHDLDTEPCSAAGEVIAVLRRYGWDGPTSRCPRCS